MWKWEAEGSPKAIVLIVHNAYEHHRRYAWLIQRLRNDGFHVVTGDLPGHGEEGHEIHDEAFKAYRRYLKKLIWTGLDENLPLFLLGHGLGATLVLRMLQKEEIDCAGVICSSPWLQLEHQPPLLKTVLTKLSQSLKIRHEITSEMLSRNASFIESFREDPHYNSTVTAAWYRDMQAVMRSVVQSDTPIQDVPLLVHLGGADKITDPAFTRKWVCTQQLSELQMKNWKFLYHDVFQEPERQEVYLYTRSFMFNVLRSLGYIVDDL